MTNFKLRLPVNNPRITQRFGEHPERYIIYGLPGHDGIDFGTPENSSVYASADGLVTEVVSAGAYGLHIRIVSYCVYEHIYAHLNQSFVNVGNEVKADSVIGLSGGKPGNPNAGNSSGPHLHLGLKLEGATAHKLTNYPSNLIDPYTFLDFPSVTVYTVNAPSGLRLRSGAGYNYPILKTLSYNTRVTYARDTIGLWTRVTTPDNITGWCYTSYLRES